MYREPQFGPYARKRKSKPGRLATLAIIRDAMLEYRRTLREGRDYDVATIDRPVALARIQTAIDVGLACGVLSISECSRLAYRVDMM